MSVYIVYQWSIRPEDSERCNDQLERIAGHVGKDHPEILGVRTFIQSTGPLPRRAYIWWEEWPSLTTLEEDEGTPLCMELWKPIEAMAQAGTWTSSMWLDAPPAAQFTRGAASP
jgi:hypothetical protein